MKSVWICVLAAILTLAACSKNEKDGGQHGGGGYVPYSTPDHVKTTIQQAFALASEPEFTQNIFYSFISYSVYRDVPDLDRKFESFMLDFIGTTSTCLNDDTYAHSKWGKDLTTAIHPAAPDCQIDRFKTRVSKLLSGAQIVIKETGDCGMSTDGHADASVSQDGTQICYSVENLQRVPPTVLLREILALTFHEMFHIAGYGEDDARWVQVKFGEYYDIRFLSASKEWFVTNSRDHIEMIVRITKQLPQLLEYWQKYKSPDVWLAFQALNMNLMVLPYRNDLTALQIAMKDAPKDALVAYIHSVSNLLDRHMFRTSYEYCRTGQYNCDVNTPEGFERVKKLTEDLAKDADVLEKNWKAIMGEGDWDCSAFEDFVQNKSNNAETMHLGPEGPFLYQPVLTCTNPPQK